MKFRWPFESLDMKSGGPHSKKNEGKNLVANISDTTLSESLTPEQDDKYNYAVLIALYTLQGIPLGLSASIPFLIQQKVKPNPNPKTVTTI